MMGETDIRFQIAATLGAVDGVGRVHTYQRWAATWSEFLALFRVSGDDGDRVCGCTVSRQSTARREFTTHQIQRQHVYRIRFYMGLEDAEDTESAFQAMLDRAAEAIDANYTLSGACETTTPEWGPMNGLAGLQIDHVDMRLFGSVLCHFAECRMGAQEAPADV